MPPPRTTGAGGPFYAQLARSQVKQRGRPWWWKRRGGASEGGRLEGAGKGGGGGGGVPHVGITAKRRTGSRQVKPLSQGRSRSRSRTSPGCRGGNDCCATNLPSRVHPLTSPPSCPCSEPGVWRLCTQDTAPVHPLTSPPPPAPAVNQVCGAYAPKTLPQCSTGSNSVCAPKELPAAMGVM